MSTITSLEKRARLEGLFSSVDNKHITLTEFAALMRFQKEVFIRFLHELGISKSQLG